MKIKLILRIVLLTPVAIVTYIPLGCIVYGLFFLAPVCLGICIVLYPLALLLDDEDFTSLLDEGIEACFGVTFRCPALFWYSLIIKGEFPETL